MLRFTLLASLLMADVYGSDKGCEAPSYFEAEANEFDSLTMQRMKGHYYYDSVMQRERITGQPTFGENDWSYDILELWKEKKMYVLDLTTRRCNVTKLQGEFRPLEADSSYAFVKSLIFGMIRVEGVEIGVWFKQENSTYAIGQSVREFTRQHCYPYFESFNGEMNGKKTNFQRTFMNIMTQPVNPDAFKVPKECQK